MRWLLPVLALAVLSGCGGGETPSSTDPAASSSATSAATPSTTMAGDPSAPRTLTPADDGRTYTMVIGQSVTLALTDPAEPEPELEGTSVLLIQVVNIDATARREWEVRAVEGGISTISGGGADAWVIRMEVSGTT